MSRSAGGLFNSVRKSAITLADKGIAVSVYALQDEYSHADEAEWSPLRPRIFKTRFTGLIPYAPALASALGKVDHDVLHLHGIWGLHSRAVAHWRQQTGRPVMISPRGMLDPWALSHSAWKKRIAGAWFENNNLKASDCLHALNESEAASMRSYGLTNPIAIIPNGTDLPDIARNPAVNAPRTLLFLGRIHPKKGLAELIKAWANACRDDVTLADKWRLDIAGWDDGGHVKNLESLIAESGVSSSVSLVGPAFGNAKDRLLKSADAFVLPSFSEGLPMSVLEAWAYSLPVLMTEQCNLPVGFESGAAVRIHSDPAKLANDLRLSLQRDDLQKIGEAGRDLVARVFAWQRIASTHIEVYQWMCGNSPQPDCVRKI